MLEGAFISYWGSRAYLLKNIISYKFFSCYLVVFGNTGGGESDIGGGGNGFAGVKMLLNGFTRM